MEDKPTDVNRRTMLQASAGLAIGALAIEQARAAAAAPPPGKVGEFDFLAGHWKIRHRQWKSSTRQWDEFDGEATCWSVLGGAGSIEELRIPSRNFSGLGIRLFEVEKRVWSDFWVGGRDGVLTTPGLTGAFVDGVGSFVADETEGDAPIKVRGVWDRITPTSCRWRQGVSRDGGNTWEESWFMDWVRAPA